MDLETQAQGSPGIRGGIGNWKDPREGEIWAGMATGDVMLPVQREREKEREREAGEGEKNQGKRGRRGKVRGG